MMQDAEFMRSALDEARKAFEAGEVPIGAVAVENGVIISRGRNRVEENNSVCCHAEIEAIREVEKLRGDWRMHGITLYVTKEPCPMCAGMLVNSRIKRIVYGAGDPAGGFCGGAFDINSIPGLLWHPEITGGVCGDESLELIRQFFRSRRAAK